MWLTIPAKLEEKYSTHIANKIGRLRNRPEAHRPFAGSLGLRLYCTFYLRSFILSYILGSLSNQNSMINVLSAFEEITMDSEMLSPELTGFQDFQIEKTLPDFGPLALNVISQ